MKGLPETGPAVGALERASLRGGAVLVVRGGLGLVLTLVGSLVLVGLLGPTEYGRYAGALAVTTVVLIVARVGVDVALLRSAGAAHGRGSDRAFSLLLVSSLAVAAAVLLLTVPLAASSRYDDYVGPLRALVLLLPINVLWIPAQTRLERALRYGPLAVVELTGTALYYVVAVVGAGAGWGVWSGVVGYACWQVFLLLASCRVAQYRPRWDWDRAWIAETLRFGIGYTGAQWLWQLRALLNPLVVGGLLGPAAVGQVALAQRLVENVSFVSRAAWRLLVVVLSRAGGNPDRFGRAITAGMRFHVLLLAPGLAGCAALLPLLVEPTLGPAWEPVTWIFPWMAVGVLVNALFAVQASALYVLGRNAAVGRFHAAYVLVALLAMMVLVPQYGVVGYGAGEVCAAVTYVLLHRSLSAHLRVDYSTACLWLAALLPLVGNGLVPPVLRPLTILPVVVLLCLPATRHQVTLDAMRTWRALRARPVADGAP